MHQQGKGVHLGWGCEWSVKLEGNGIYLFLFCENSEERDDLSSAIAYFSGPKNDRAALYNDEDERISLPKKLLETPVLGNHYSGIHLTLERL